MAKQKNSFLKIRSLLDVSTLRSDAEVTGLHQFLHFWVLVGKSFVGNRCPVRASALSYSTLLAIIPLCALAIGVTSSLLKDEGEERIYHFIEQFVSGVVPSAAAPLRGAAGALPETSPQGAPTEGGSTALSAPPGVSGNAAALPGPAAAGEDRVATAQREAARKIHEFIQNTRSGTLGVTGMVLLVFVALRMLSQIETTFNDIWGVTRGRNWLLRIVLHWTTITLGPLLVIAALGLTGGPYLQATQELMRNMPVVGPMFFPVLTLLLLWLAFALLYQLVPNTKVNFSAALVGGVVAGSLWHLINVSGFLFISRVVTNFKIYGSLGLVPVFMVGVYLSWLVLLLGAQLAYAFQNRTLYLQEKIAENVNQRGREFVALRLLTCIGQRFQGGLPPPTLREMSRELAVPSRLVQQVLQTLVAARLVTEIQGAEAAFTPARPLDSINAHHVLQAMRATNGQELVTREEPLREEVYGEFARIQEAEKLAAASITMLALIQRAQARLELAAPDSHRGALDFSLPGASPLEPSSGVAATEPMLTLEAAEPAVQQVAAADGIPAAGQTSGRDAAIATPDDAARGFPL